MNATSDLYHYDTSRAIRHATEYHLLHATMPNPRRHYEGFIPCPEDSFSRPQPEFTGSPVRRSHRPRLRQSRLPGSTPSMPGRPRVRRTEWNALDPETRIELYHGANRTLPVHPALRETHRQRDPTGGLDLPAAEVLPRMPVKNPIISTQRVYEEALVRPKEAPHQQTSPLAAVMRPGFEIDYNARAERVREALKKHPKADAQQRYGTITRKPVPLRKNGGRQVLGELSTNRRPSGSRVLVDKAKKRVSSFGSKLKTFFAVKEHYW